MYTHTRAHIHIRGANPTGQLPRGYTLDNANAGGAVTYNSSLITRKVLNEKIFYCSVLESSWGNLQEYVMKNGGPSK